MVALCSLILCSPAIAPCFLSLSLVLGCQVFVAAFPFAGNSRAGELTLAAGDQVLVGGDGADAESLDWLFGEHQGGDCGWFPRHTGQFFVFDTGANAGAGAVIGSQMRLRPQAGPGAFGVPAAVGMLPGASRACLVGGIVAALEAAEAGFAEGCLGALVGAFVAPLELRDSKAKISLVTDPNVAILCGQVRDLHTYHGAFLRKLRAAQAMLPNEAGAVAAVAAALVDLTSRFMLCV